MWQFFLYAVVPDNVFLQWEGRTWLHEGHHVAISSVLHHHPRARVWLYSNSLDAANATRRYQQRGLTVQVVRYNCTALSLGRPGESHGRLLQAALDEASAIMRREGLGGRPPDKAVLQRAGREVTGHKAFLTMLSEWIRWILVYNYGGLWMDFDMILLRPILNVLEPNAVGVDHDEDGHSFDCREPLSCSHASSNPLTSVPSAPSSYP
jgi:hypothetical protein